MSEVNTELLEACKEYLCRCRANPGVPEEHNAEIDLRSAIMMAGAEAYEAELPVDSDWLISLGFMVIEHDEIVCPCIATPALQRMQWHHNGMFIDGIPIALTRTRGQVLDLLRGLGMNPEIMRD